jgi:hypothetical protein
MGTEKSWIVFCRWKINIASKRLCDIFCGSKIDHLYIYIIYIYIYLIYYETKSISAPSCATDGDRKRMDASRKEKLGHQTMRPK